MPDHPPEAPAGRSTVTIKVSKYVRDHIQKKTSLNEPIDRTLRKLLGLKVLPGEYPPKGKLRLNHYSRRKSSVMTTVKVTQFLRDYIASKAKWNESIDHTLRRLLRLEPEKEAVRA
jgi:hypothetical protein